MVDSKIKGTTIKNSRRVQSAKPRLYRSENTEKEIVKAKETTKLRPTSAFTTNNIELDIYGYESGKMLCETSDKSNCVLESMNSALTKEISSQNIFQTYPIERNKGKYEMYECIQVTVQEI